MSRINRDEKTTFNKSGGAARDIKRIAVINRGEPAVRFLRALRDYNAERDTSIEAVAMVTDTDIGSPFTRMADAVIHLGPALQAGEDNAMVSAYLRHQHVIDAMVNAGCDAAWPGWGFIAEDAAFVSRLEARNIVFLGPSAEAMRRLGDKIESKRLAEQCGVPMAPWWEIPNDADSATICQAAAEIGYPLMVKASAGGGGRGIRKVNSDEELLAAVPAAREEVRKIFGAGGLFIESCVTGARHIEVQLIADNQHRALALGVRDCSIQRRNQKILEETPSMAVNDATAKHLCESSARLAEAAGYRSAGTAEFLYDPKTNKAFFLEVNSRLQVEHTVTECVTGVDLVHAQIDVARGLPLTASGADRGDGQPPVPRGWSIEARLCAEDASRGFAPSPGVLRVFRAPCGPGVRVDSGVVEGTEIASEFDSMIAKVIATGSSRNQAMARLKRALEELQVVVEDGATNKALLLELLQRDEVRNATADTGWLDIALKDGSIALERRTFEALAFAAIVEYRRRRLADIAAFFVSAQDGIPQNPPPPGALEIDLAIAGRRIALNVHDLGNGRYLVGPSDRMHIVIVHFDGDSAASLTVAGERHDVRYAYGRKGIAIEVDGALCTVEPASGGALKAPAPAMVVQVGVEEGQHIETGERLLTLEAMKLEMPLYATESGTVKTVLCSANQQVAAGQVLVVIEPEGDECSNDADDNWPTPKRTPLERLFAQGGPDFVALDSADVEAAQEAIGDLVAAMRSVMLGYDVSEAFATGLHKLLGGALDFSTLRYPERWLPVTRLLTCFADIQGLFDRTLPVSTGGASASPHSLFYELCRELTDETEELPEAIASALQTATAWYGITSLDDNERLREALWRMHVGNAHHERRHQLCSLLLRTAIQLHEAGVEVAKQPDVQLNLDRIAQTAKQRSRYVADNARQAEYILFAQPRYVRRLLEVKNSLHADMKAISEATSPEQVRALVEKLVISPDSLVPQLVQYVDPTEPATAGSVLEIIMRRTFSGSSCAAAGEFSSDRAMMTRMLIDEAQQGRGIAAVLCHDMTATQAIAEAKQVFETSGWQEKELDVVLSGCHTADTTDALPEAVQENFTQLAVERVTVTWHDGNALRLRTFLRKGDDLVENVVLRGIHPDYARRFELDRLGAFDLEAIDTPAPVHAFFGRAKENPRDERIFVYTGVREIPDASLIAVDPNALWEFERAYFEGIRVLRQVQVSRSSRNRFHWNRLTIYVRRPVQLTVEEIAKQAARFESPTRGLGLEKVVVRCRLMPGNGESKPVDRAIVMAKPGKHRMHVSVHEPTDRPVRAMSDYALKLVRTRRLGLIYPYELVRILSGAGGGDAPHPDLAQGRFIEHDLSEPNADRDQLVAVDRPYGQNSSAVVVGIMENHTEKHPEGMRRLLIAADPTRSMCALAEPECRRILAALDLAAELQIPVEWVSISAGAKIAMDSGTENLDWTARVLKRLVEFTQLGGVIHIIVCGVNVGAQSYWNAEATMLMHTRGLLIMTASGSMVLTGKKALEYSGSVAAEDERGIGGFERVMGPNGQAQLFARDLGEAYSMLMEHYRCSYRSSGESLPRRHHSADPAKRSILTYPYKADTEDDFTSVGDIFDDSINPGRKRPFDVRAVMRATIDTDCDQLERFSGMPEGETAVIWDAHLGGYPVCLIGFQSRPLQRRGRIPTDGPDTWTGGTLFPQSSKKVARAINAASGNRPVVVLANLSGFDGSPESLRALQLEYGAEIGRAVVNFDGPIIFVVIGRYHGGAYVVFSKALNANLCALALTGTYASVIGGAPAAAVVFPREVTRRAEADGRIVKARAAVKTAKSAQKPRERERLQSLLAEVKLEKQGEVAAEFDAIHTVDRAVQVGSLDAVIKPEELRPEIVKRLAQWWQHADSARASTTPVVQA